VSELLKAQYEALPYPARDPGDEKRRVIITELDRLSGINHFVFGGELDRSRPFRALVAGGGTGDAVVALAFQMRAAKMTGEVVYIDLSEASQKVARERVAVHGFENVRFETGSFLDRDRFTPASFDFINCSGVLHHLESPLEGLRALARLLRPGGGLGIMLYGALGRTGIYPVQEILRTLAPDSLGPAERVALARRLVENLPASNWLVRNTAMLHGGMSDAEVFDMLLHSRDRAFEVPQIVELAEAASLRLLTFIPPVAYRPDHYFKDADLRRRLAGASPLEQAALAEKLAGSLAKHEFYLVDGASTVSAPDPDDFTCIPLLDGFPPFPAQAAVPVQVPLRTVHFQLNATFSPLALRILALVNGERSLEEIARQSGLAAEQFAQTWRELYPILHGHGYLHLSRKPLPGLTYSATP